MYSYLNYQHEGPPLPLTKPTTFFRNITAKRALSLLLHYTALLKNRPIKEKYSPSSKAVQKITKIHVERLINLKSCLRSPLDP